MPPKACLSDPRLNPPSVLLSQSSVLLKWILHSVKGELRMVTAACNRGRKQSYSTNKNSDSISEWGQNSGMISLYTLCCAPSDCPHYISNRNVPPQNARWWLVSSYRYFARSQNLVAQPATSFVVNVKSACGAHWHVIIHLLCYFPTKEPTSLCTVAFWRNRLTK